MSTSEEYIARMQEIAARARDFQTNDASDPKEFSRSVVEDLRALADAISYLIKRDDNSKLHA
ncbi:hypothetical protein [uncultured Friedmanniella sp.]|uniref:hypothetical protein n=1 Tax=uncultured Friedmanniella sp. TaxID=335381 RepID=UPI0035CAD9E6